ncbi:HNH endonuclease signature motif containing protein [Azospirillum sp.]|uniref:HNH endonuclease signature motif containing protein n=1 Tax=Azospirillum sp. TaxID=34012 RepID=UPI002D4E7943|nr:HNH endonuclease signature motif containing protein [Azospirillum sp.]HYF88987.1 HNH endonuclease signature motif containing protein [Azospirillum sp.]
MGKLRSLPPLVGSLDMRTAKPAPKVAERFYASPEWRALRSSLIRQRGRRCERCGKTHEDDGAPVRLIGDHKRERKDGGAELDPANVELMCLACHNAKTAQVRARRLRG